ncbi:DUF2939 domain-containing protein [Sphingomonas sp. HITSZ_GF]|uniref:DUF2939 domain-containing protein n=1 Tax=Sphingomonas sp. HITSZ_GF TaxID=3037247 RepID=UPI00240DFA4C|nr:DUF2939 domain-containing protein [Sphingomonas sp. HITSZ_GF]MDG2532901.1 DUF2939 domain-containing protein [Sphingomonas sp. HITSZ_GF]
MKRWLIALLVIALLAAGGWAWGSPKYTLWQMKRAAEARDVDALASHVDFPAVRASVKDQLSSRMQGNGEGGVLGALVRSGIADTVVDAAVSPEGMRFIFAAAPLTESEERPGTIRVKASEMRYRRTAFDRFELARGDGAILVFRLRGLEWKLTDIRLPPDALR